MGKISNLYRKSMFFAIIALFFGVGILPSISGNVSSFGAGNTLSIKAGNQNNNVIFSDNFDDGDISDWTVTTAGNGVFETSTVKYVSSPYSVHMKSLNKNDQAMGVSPSFNLDLSEDYSIAFSFLVPSTNNHWFEVFNNHQTYLVINSGTQLRWYDGSSSYSIMNLNTDQWCSIEIEVHQSFNTYDVYIDDDFKTTCAMWVHTGFEDDFRIGDRNNDQGSYFDYGDAYWDDFVISQSMNNPPHTPRDPSPDNGAADIDVNTDLGWDGGDPDTDETVYYDVYLGIESNPPFIEQIGPYPADQTRITYDLEKLNYNTQYYWRIDAIDSYGYTTTGPSWTYTTADDQPPYQPSNPNPANGSTDVAANINLSWTGEDPDLGDVVKYDVYFGTDPNPPNVVLKQLETMYGPGILDGDTQYYWRIDAWDDYGYSVTGETWTFRTEIQPDKPATPSGKISGKAGTEYIYMSNTTDPDGDQVYYWFDWGDNTNSGWLGPFDSGETVSAKHVWTVKGDYEIKVKAKDVYDAESEWSDPLSISMPKNKAINPFLLFLERLIERFPMLEQILQPIYNNLVGFW